MTMAASSDYGALRAIVGGAMAEEHEGIQHISNLSGELFVSQVMIQLPLWSIHNTVGFICRITRLLGPGTSI